MVGVSKVESKGDTKVESSIPGNIPISAAADTMQKGTWPNTYLGISGSQQTDRRAIQQMISDSGA